MFRFLLCVLTDMEWVVTLFIKNTFHLLFYQSFSWIPHQITFLINYHKPQTKSKINLKRNHSHLNLNLNVNHPRICFKTTLFHNLFNQLTYSVVNHLNFLLSRYHNYCTRLHLESGIYAPFDNLSSNNYPQILTP